MPYAMVRRTCRSMGDSNRKGSNNLKHRPLNHFKKYLYFYGEFESTEHVCPETSIRKCVLLQAGATDPPLAFSGCRLPFEADVSHQGQAFSKRDRRTLAHGPTSRFPAPSLGVVGSGSSSLLSSTHSSFSFVSNVAVLAGPSRRFSAPLRFSEAGVVLSCLLSFSFKSERLESCLFGAFADVGVTASVVASVASAF